MMYSYMLRISVHFEGCSSAIRLLQQLNFLFNSDISPPILADRYHTADAVQKEMKFSIVPITEMMVVTEVTQRV